ncbi:DUF2780 domain-containing protein [Shewanella avicenniae]|uniref:DUF2780 domain-containing protein n=1 Tax=Shewanella avicenniae TaxID=2814294 RepID=A0ABX7QS58_9GAMM|nr:DUF2780 domain-containing protein [Shewanella avicenniae]QSX33877.1 DUF2780 domain-containing protein [Shewanella avicenniae]
MKASVVLLAALTVPMAANAGLLDTLSSKLKQTTTQAPTQAQTTATTDAVSGDLVSSVMSQLNLNQQQAEGGLGSLLTMAKSSMNTTDFGQISNAIPNVDSLLAAAPSLDSNSGMSGLLSKAGSLGSSLQGSAMVYDAFSKLGISKELAAPMVQILKNYLQSQSGEGTAALLGQGLSALM